MKLKKEEAEQMLVAMKTRHELLSELLNTAIEREKQFNGQSTEFRRFIKQDEKLVFMENSFIVDVCSIRMRIQTAIERNEMAKNFLKKEWEEKCLNL